MKSIFEFKNYQSYLLYFFQLKRGNQARLAEYLDCRSSFLTQVIDERVEISLDQSAKIPNYLGLNKNEKMAFFHYVQKEKMHDPAEKRFLEEQIQFLKLKNSTIKERLNDVGELEDSTKTKYYSSWIYGAVHIFCAFTWVQDATDIMEHLKIDHSVANEAIAFLTDCGLVQTKNNTLSVGKKQIHLNEDSPYIFNHHINWRLIAIEKLNKKAHQILNFSSLIGISKKDAEAIKEIFLKSISETNLIVQQSGEEVAYLINIDFMEI